MTIESIDPRVVYDRFRHGEAMEVIDVRTPAEYRSMHAVVGRSVPLDAVDAERLAAEAAGRPLFVMCASGVRARACCDRLMATGMRNIAIIQGGLKGWAAAGLPVVVGEKAVTVERQVRIVAGTLVLLGVVLGLTVHAYWLGISAFIGAGLVFAGITDRCGMAVLLARMPWNRGAAACTSPTTRPVDACAG